MTILEKELDCQILLETWGLYTVKDRAGFIFAACFISGSKTDLSSVRLCVADMQLVGELPADYATKITGVASANLDYLLIRDGHASRVEPIHRARFGPVVSEEDVQVWDKRLGDPTSEDDYPSRERRLSHMSSGDIIICH